MITDQDVFDGLVHIKSIEVAVHYKLQLMAGGLIKVIIVCPEQ